MCMPSEKLARCSSQAWTALESKFQGDPCPVPSGVNIGGAPAPAYLSILGWEACLGKISNNQGLTTLCLPTEKLAQCSSQAWEALKSKFQGDRCSIPSGNAYLKFVYYPKQNSI